MLFKGWVGRATGRDGRRPEATGLLEVTRGGGERRELSAHGGLGDGGRREASEGDTGQRERRGEGRGPAGRKEATVATGGQGRRRGTPEVGGDQTQSVPVRTLWPEVGGDQTQSVPVRPNSIRNKWLSYNGGNNNNGNGNTRDDWQQR